MIARKSVLGMLKDDWKAKTLFWSMLVCIGLIVSLVVVLSRII
jgi:hypothetical protein